MKKIKILLLISITILIILALFQKKIVTFGKSLIPYEYKVLIKAKIFRLINRSDVNMARVMPFTQFDEINYSEIKIEIEKQKPVGYLDIHNNDLIIVDGKGKIFYEKLKNVYSKNINFKNVETNIKEKFNIKNLDIQKLLITDIFIKKGLLFISYAFKVSEKCVSPGIIYGVLNFKNIEFNNLYKTDQCSDPEKNPNILYASKGGRIKSLDDKIYFTIGDYSSGLSMDMKSIFGKILEIDLNTKKNTIFSSGHRNPQGLEIFLQNGNKILLSTEHGPQGGDEINNIKFNKNYGWPISSYGEHYIFKSGDNFNLKKNHIDHGYEEPIFSFTPSIGISEIIKVPKNFSKYWEESFLITSLNGRTIYRALFDENFNNIKNIEKIYLGQRMRDIAYDSLNDSFVILLEDIPSLAILNSLN